MSPALSIAASLSPDVRQDIGIQVLSHSQPISHIAAAHQVSRKFVYQQGDKAQQALDESFAPSQGDDDVLFHLPVTKNWLYQVGFKKGQFKVTLAARHRPSLGMI